MSQRNPLDQFRRPAPQEKKLTLSGKKPYEAFDPRDKVWDRLEIRTLTAPHHAPHYRFLMDISWNGEFFSKVVLFYSFMMVEIEGSNLENLVLGLKMAKVSFIQDFNANEFDNPAEGTPIINSIKVTVRAEEQATLDVMKEEMGRKRA